MEVILDSSFIVSCVRRRIDFISELEGLGFKPVVPREVLQEIKDLTQKAGREDRVAAEMALKIVEERKVRKVGLGKSGVDEQLIKKGRNGVYIATLDAAIKRSVPNRISIVNASNSLIVDRD